MTSKTVEDHSSSCSNAHSLSALPIGYELQEYRIEEVISISKDSINYLALDMNLESLVNLKEYYPADLIYRETDYSLSVRDNQQAKYYAHNLKGFWEEIIRYASLRHPGIPHAIRYFADNRTGYMVTEYDQGQTLADYLAALNSAMDEETCLNIFVPVLLALDKAHGRGIFHQYINASNILIRDTGEPLLLDFCQTCHKGRDKKSTGKTEAEAQTEYENESRIEDIYALGELLYHCITGLPAIPLEQRLSQLEQGKTDPLLPVNPGTGKPCSQTLLKLIDSMIAISPEHRPQTVQAIIIELGSKASNREWVKPVQFQTNHMKNKGEEGEQIARDYEHLAFYSRIQKLIITGTPGAGKSVAIKTLSDIQPMVRQEMITIAEVAEENTESVPFQLSLDYGVMKIADNESLHLYGAPGHVDDSYIRNVLSQGAVGFILLIDNSRKDPLNDLDELLTRFLDDEDTGIAIGVTHVDHSRTPAITDYHAYLEKKESRFFPRIPVFSVDARSYRHMALLVQALLYSINTVPSLPMLAEDQCV